jgi:hypothetical protein
MLSCCWRRCSSSLGWNANGQDSGRFHHMSSSLPADHSPESDGECDEDYVYHQLQSPSECLDDDFRGPELLWVLRTPGGRFRAGKSYRPDPSGARVAVKVADYKQGAAFLCSVYSVDDLNEFFELLKALSTDPDAFIIRGMMAEWGGVQRRHPVSKEVGYIVHRRTVKIHGPNGYFTDWPHRHLQMLDLDGVPLPQGMSVVSDPEASVKWAAQHLLPPEFGDASFVYQLSSSAGLTKHDNELNVHLWFYTQQSCTSEQLRIWAKWWNAKQRCKIIDPALYNEVQPHYTNEPELLGGLVDPLSGRRVGLIARSRRTVDFYMPTAQEVADELGLRQKRASKEYNRARPTNVKRRSKTVPSDDDIETAQEPETVLESGAEPFPGGPYFDAVNIGHGWRGYLMAIGFEGHIRTQIRAAVGSYFYESGSRGDRAILKVEIERAIEDSPFLDKGEPWSRSRGDARNYLVAPPGGSSNVDEMIAAIAALQSERERQAYEQYEPTWRLPELTADEAFARIQVAVMEAITDAQEYRRRHGNPLDPRFAFEHPSKTAINCSTGTGKTQAMIAGVLKFLRSDETARIVIAVPTHKLGEGLADRINGEYGADVATEWYGTDHPDPLAPDEKMCPLADAAAELVSLGGKLQHLCIRRHGSTEYCPHHPIVAGANGCGYRRQQLLEVRNKTRVWIIPATMLAIAPPVALKRDNKHGGEGDFDLLVIDEAPWFNLIPNEPVKVPIEWLAPEWWGPQASRAADHQKWSAIEVFAKIHGALARLPLGEIPADEFTSLGITESNLRSTRRTVWKFKLNLRALVKPGTDSRELTKALSEAAPRNSRVVGVAEALSVLRRHVGGKLAPSGVVLTEDKEGKRYLCLRWRKDIDPAWLKAPALYLDAANIGSFEIAKAWLPDLVLKLETTAKAPHTRVIQLVETQMSYRKLLAGSEATPQKNDETAEKNQARLAGVIAGRGHSGLVICPKELRLAWEKARSLPADWIIWNFGAIRGRDEANAVPQLVVVSRPLPKPAQVEIMAETIFGRSVQRLPFAAWYSKMPVGRLMVDGTGRRALALRHPDPLVEAVRFAICEGELVQAVGRGRGVRRTADTRLEVLILTDVPIPIPVDTLTTWKELCDYGPLSLLATRGVVPLDYAGIVTALSHWFNDSAKLKNWLQYRPEIRSKLAAIRKMARDAGVVDLCEFGGISYRDSYIGDSAQLAAYSYRRPRSRQSNLVLVNDTMHDDPRAATEAVLGPLDDFRLAKDTPRRRSRRQGDAMDVVSQSLLDQLFSSSGTAPSSAACRP